jgi:hypothetical protein
MKRIPTDLDLEVLVGRQVEMVCFVAHSVSLHLDAHIVIRVEGPYTHRRHGDADTSEPVEFPVSHSNLPCLISNEIVGVRADEVANLTLRFSNGDTLRLLISDGPYESYQIKIADRMVVV